MASLAMQKHHYCIGKWLPEDQAVLEDFIRRLIEKVEKKDRQIEKIEEVDADEENRGLSIPDLHPPVQALKDLIDTDSEVNMFFHQMFIQVPFRPPYVTDPTGKWQVRSYRRMLRLINHIMTTAPEYNESGLVGFPINAILNWPMATVGGYSAFLNDKVNKCFKDILNYWGEYLKSPASCYVLSKDPDHGWFGKKAMAEMPNFSKEFVCDPLKVHHGFKSWDDFFVRRYRKGVRPVAHPNDERVIVSPCEAAPYKVQKKVKARSRFWVKSQPYSLMFMLNNDPLADQFIGGTVYQAFLSALSYHRWHSPVDGTVIKTEVVDGSYYSEAQSMGFDEAAPNTSQGYICEVATRGFIYIQADNHDIGLMCFMAVGMAEVSTCDITVQVGQKIKKGDETGMFHFGGSTFCLIFRPEVNVIFDLHGQEPGLHSENIPVKSVLAVAL